MAATVWNDISKLIPTIERNAIQNIENNSGLIGTGALSVQNNMASGGSVLTIRSVEPLDKTSNVIAHVATDGTRTVSPITGTQEQAVIRRFGQIWAMSKEQTLGIQGVDPSVYMAAFIPQQVGQLATNTIVNSLALHLKTLFAGVLSTTHVIDKSDEVISLADFNAVRKLYGRSGARGTLYVHTEVFNQILNTIPTTLFNSQVLFPEWVSTGDVAVVGGVPIVVDDILCASTGENDDENPIYPSYYALPGAFVLDFQRALELDIWYDNATQKGNIGSSLNFLTHLMGTSWKSTSPINPTAAQFGTTSNFERVATHDRYIRCVQLLTCIEVNPPA